MIIHCHCTVHAHNEKTQRGSCTGGGDLGHVNTLHNTELKNYLYDYCMNPWTHTWKREEQREGEKERKGGRERERERETQLVQVHNTNHQYTPQSQRKGAAQ